MTHSDMAKEVLSVLDVQARVPFIHAKRAEELRCWLDAIIKGDLVVTSKAQLSVVPDDGDATG